MQFNRRRAGAFSVAALTALALGASTLSGSTASAARPTAKAGEKTYNQLSKKAAKDYIKLDLLALNDFHGNLEVIDPTKSSSGRINNTPAGGAAYLATKLRQERAKSRAAGAVPLTVAAGDLIGASPLLSAAFHDEPTIDAMNEMGLQVASVGNHEFDEGYRELQRMQRGGCIDDGDDGENGANSCPEGTFGGADFQYLAANVKYEDPTAHRRSTVFPATKVIKVKGVKVGFIGMTLEGTAGIVAQAGIEGIDFTDEVKTANALVPKLRKRGVKSIVVLLHEGVTPTDATAYNNCTGVSGPALEIAQRLNARIDAVVSGHTHQPYNCVVEDPKGNPRMLTSASSFGRMVTKMHLLIDPATRDVVRPAAFAENMIVNNGESVTPAADILDLISTFNTLVQPIANEVIGHIEGADTVSNTQESDGQDSPVGNLIADAQKDAESIAGDDPPVIALMNPGGIRGALVENDAGDVTYGAAFTVQPFNNFMVSMDLTGEQIKSILNEQWNGANEGTRKILQVSGLKYTWDTSEAGLPDTDAIVGDVLVDEDGDPATDMVPLEDGTTYRVAANNFLSDGGDAFGTFVEGTDKLVAGLDIDALRAYLLAHDPVSVTPTDRISQQP